MNKHVFGGRAPLEPREGDGILKPQCEWVSSFLKAHQHMKGLFVPQCEIHPKPREWIFPSQPIWVLWEPRELPHWGTKNAGPRKVITCDINVTSYTVTGPEPSRGRYRPVKGATLTQSATGEQTHLDSYRQLLFVTGEICWQRAACMGSCVLGRFFALSTLWRGQYGANGANLLPWNSRRFFYIQLYSPNMMVDKE